MALSVFIASSQEARDKGLALKLAEALGAQGFTLLRWWEEFRPGDITIDRLQDIAEHVDAAALILSSDDKVWYRGTESDGPRDNCIFECGMFVSRIGLQRSGIIAQTNVKIPSDLAGVTVERYTNDNDFTTAAERLARALKDRAPVLHTDRIVPVISDPDIYRLRLGDTKIPRSWCSRALYLRDEGASSWLAIADDPHYLLTRHGDRLGVSKLYLDALKQVRPATVISFGPGDGSPDRQILGLLRQGEPHLRWIPVDISSGLVHYVANRIMTKVNVHVPVGIVGDFEDGQAFIRTTLEEYARSPILIAMLGATFGNLDGSSQLFLTDLKGQLGNSDVLMLDVPLAGTQWSFEDDPRARTADFGEVFMRFLAGGLATSLGMPTQEILKDAATRIGTEIEGDDESAEHTKVFRIFDKESTRTILRFRRYNWESFLKWVEQDIGFAVKFSARTAPLEDAKDVLGVGLVLLAKQ